MMEVPCWLLRADILGARWPRVCRRGPGCNKPFSFLLRPRHHCRSCGQLFCGACAADRLLLPPKFQLAEPQRVCAACRALLLPIQPLLAGSIAPAVRQPVHDVYDYSALRSLLNPPLTSRLDTDIYTATNIVRAFRKGEPPRAGRQARGTARRGRQQACLCTAPQDPGPGRRLAGCCVWPPRH